MMILKIQNGLKSYYTAESSSPVIRKFAEQINNIINTTIQNILIYFQINSNFNLSLQTRPIALNIYFFCAHDAIIYLLWCIV
jgi:hypothetical protein